MSYRISVETASPLTLAAVRATVAPGGVPAAWKPALDKVWAFLRTSPVSHAGLNVFLYRHPESPGAAMTVEFGVQVSERFDEEGDVHCVSTPAGAVAQTVHVGPYGGLGGAHAAIQQWCKANQRPLGAYSWEVYGHWNNDPDKLETTVCYLLA